MTPEQRRETLLTETEDVAREDQIVMMDGVSCETEELPLQIMVNLLVLFLL